MVKFAIEGNFEESYKHLHHLWKLGYAASDIIGTLYKVVKNYEMEEHMKLEFLRVILNNKIANNCLFRKSVSLIYELSMDLIVCYN
jgi:hypothetical protein